METAASGISEPCLLIDFNVGLGCSTLLWSRGKTSFQKIHVLSEVGEYFLSFEKNIWCLVRGLVEKDISVTGC